MELAHANRVAGMGQLSASIAHEVSQPVGRPSPTHKPLALAGRPTVEPGRGAAGAQSDRQRCQSSRRGCRPDPGFVKKTPSRKEAFEINGSIIEVIALTSGEAVKHGISVQTQLAEGLPLIQGDRIRLQQVIFNLMMNAVEAMSGVREGPRELCDQHRKSESDDVLVAVRDSGPGLAPESLGASLRPSTPPSLVVWGWVCRSAVRLSKRTGDVYRLPRTYLAVPSFNSPCPCLQRLRD